MPLGDSVELSTGRLLRGLIFAPDESRRRSTFLRMPLGSSFFSEMTLSRPLTGNGELGKKERERWRTVETADDGLLVNALLHDYLDMGVCTGERLDGVEEEGAGGVGGGPGVAELEYELANLRQEGSVAVGRPGAQLGPEHRHGMAERGGAEWENGRGSCGGA